MNKLEFLTRIVKIQELNSSIWFRPVYASEEFLQHYIRRLHWMIEQATEEDLKNEIMKLVDEV